MHPRKLQTGDFHYELSGDRIALHPLADRDQSKLLIRQANGTLIDSKFEHLTDYLGTSGCLIFNETRVIRARLIYPRGEGLRPIEILCLNPADLEIEQAMSAVGQLDFECMVGNVRRWKGETLQWSGKNGEIIFRATPISREGGLFRIRFEWPQKIHFAAILEQLGHVPLPPYLHREDSPEDVDRYQTVYAVRDGSVAAPTAGLHFTNRVLSKIEAAGISLGRVVLHVGAGTFKPLSADVLEEHDMHAEAFEVGIDLLKNLAENPGRITAVGTTSCRTLESLYWIGDAVRRGEPLDVENAFVAQWQAYDKPSDADPKGNFTALIAEMERQEAIALRGKTQIIIVPGYRFRVIHALVTNFHQPGSTLILLVAAAIGNSWRSMYDHALSNQYRFLSYGDSTLLHIR